MHELIGWSATETATRIRQREVSAVEVVSAHLDWMRGINPSLNAVTVDTGTSALAAARAADVALGRGEPVGALYGVPVTIKENADQAGESTPNGIPSFTSIIARDDAPQVANLRRAGAIFIGRTNTPEFSFRITTDNPLRGRTCNPWTDAVTCGGSSGGAGAAVAAGIGGLAHGNDIGGSLRYPAYCNGIATIRPSLGRVPAFNASQLSERPFMMQMMSVQGPLCRSIADVRLGLSVMAMRDPRDPLYVPAPLEGPASAEPPRIGLVRANYGRPFDPEVDAALARAAEALAQAGYVVEETEAPFIEEVSRLWNDIIFTEMKVMMEDTVRRVSSPTMNRIVDHYFEMATILDLKAYMTALARRAALIRAWAVFQEQYPVLLTPVSLLKPIAPGGDETREGCVATFDSCLYLSSVNLLGLPAATVPVNLVGRVPVGVQLIGTRYREDLCLAAAQAIESVCGMPSLQLIEELKAGMGRGQI